MDPQGPSAAAENPDTVMDSVSILKEIFTLKTELISAEHNHFTRMINEAGNEFIHYLLKAAVPLVDNIPCDYRDIIKMHSSNPELFKQWKVANCNG
jgi:hypothetical protein